MDYATKKPKTPINILKQVYCVVFSTFLFFLPVDVILEKFNITES